MSSWLSFITKKLFISNWSKIYISLAVFQLLFSLPILIKALVNVVLLNQTIDNDSNYIYGHVESSTSCLISETILYILYSVWKLWIIIEGIFYLNSLTILASAWSGIFSCFCSIMLLAQSLKLSDVSREDLRIQNIYLYLLHTLVTCIIFVPAMIAAYKTTKIIGWQVYKKVGVNVSLQKMYHEAQWFTLSLKIDMFFQAILLVCAAIASTYVYSRVICALLVVFIILSLLISRLAIAKESHWMMQIFLFFQLLLLCWVIYSLALLFKYPHIWPTGIVYVFLSMFSIIFTSILAIRCQFNFKRGLKPHVQLDFYSLVPTGKRTNSVENLLSFKNSNLPIDDDIFEGILTPIDTEPSEIQPVLLQKVAPSDLERNSIAQQYSNNATPILNSTTRPQPPVHKENTFNSNYSL